jgi:hypothetical protein
VNFRVTLLAFDIVLFSPWWNVDQAVAEHAIHLLQKQRNDERHTTTRDRIVAFHINAPRCL